MRSRILVPGTFLGVVFLLSLVCSRNLYAQDERSALWQVDRIDALIESVWNDYEIKPSPRATDSEWCRRVHLDLIGRIPSVNELDAFLSSRSKSKRVELVNQLLHDDQYTEEFARNWTTIWSESVDRSHWRQ